MIYTDYLLIGCLIFACILLTIFMRKLLFAFDKLPDISFHLGRSDGNMIKLVESVDMMRVGLAEGDYADLRRRVNDVEMYVEKKMRSINAEVQGLGKHDRKKQDELDEKDIEKHLKPMENQIDMPLNGEPDPESLTGDPLLDYPDIDWEGN